MRYLAAYLTALLGAGSLASAASDPLPRPSGLEPAVAFWTRVYSEFETDGGVVHDSEHLDVVYERIRFAPGSSARSQDRQVERTKKRYRDMLRSLSSGRREGLSRDEQRVLALFPATVTNTTLRRAAGNVRFQLGQANKFRAGIVRSGAWLPHIHEVLARTGVPSELAALPHVESSFTPNAYSRVGAAGLWQFTRSTGRRFMQVDYAVDERFDPDLSTEAAARLLLENYEITGTWPLAITAYNHGAAGMRRAVRQVGTTDIARIVRSYKSRTFGFASRNFYASFLAALDVERDANRHFGSLELDEPVEAERVELEHYYAVSSLSRATGLGIDMLRAHNPALLSPVWRGEKLVPKGYPLRIPRGEIDAPAATLVASIPNAERHARQSGDDFYRVQRGDTLSRIAERLGVRQSDLVAANNLRSRHRIRAGMTLRVPRRGGSVSVARSEPPPDGLYRVQRGDNLETIARRFGTSASELVALNGLRNANRIHVGQTLRVVAAAEPERTAEPDASVPAPAEAPPVRVASAEPVAFETTSYTVRRGDTLEAIARRTGVSIRSLAEANEIRNAHRIAAGQTLKIPRTSAQGAGEPQPAPPMADATPAHGAPTAEPAAEARSAGADAVEVAVAGSDVGAPQGSDPEAPAAQAAETPSAAAEPAPEVARAAKPSPSPTASPRATTVVLTQFATREAGAADASDSIRPPAPEPERYAVGSGVQIRVEPGETIGHYAEWLEVRASHLRHINGIHYQTPITVGQSFRLDLSRVSAAEFERRRLEYHAQLEQGFFSSYRVPEVEHYVMQRGDTVWKVARRERELPVWLLHRYNPGVDFGSLRPGDRIAVPRVEPRQS
ncbi:MAG: LysM peptidoglycan-binding domain-containing protein [Deltaproteobacteria bacterium]|nr:MAG: LysM peptidoglycan-binding domain-containing protein [Deltaproteobacteria bacterium]